MQKQFPVSWSKKDIGYRLALTRKALGYSQIVIANVAHIASTTWNNYEKGIRRPSVDEARKMFLRLNLPMDWVYHGDTSQLPAALLEKIYAEVCKDGL